MMTDPTEGVRSSLSRMPVAISGRTAEGTLAMVERGYVESTRCLNFRVAFYNGDGAAEACEVIEGYNDFDGPTVAAVVRSLKGKVAYIDVGRENSPVIYVRGLGAGDVSTTMLALSEAQADEVAEVSPGIVRAWWD